MRHDEHSSSFRRSIDTVLSSSLLWGISFAVLFALCGSRLGPLTGWHFLESCQIWVWRVTLLASIVYLAATQTRLAVTLIGAWVIFLGHSFAHFYWPSLRAGVPVVDYLLHDQVSANYSFDQAKLYVGNTLGWLTVGLAYALRERDVRDLSMQRPPYSPLFISIIIGIALNTAVLAVQGLRDLSFLAAASGTAVSAGRAAALLEDGGASAVAMSSLVAGLFSLLITGRLSTIAQITFTVVIILAGYCSSFTAGRVFFVGVALTAGILFFAGMALVRSSRSLKFAAIAAVPLVVSTYTAVHLAPPRMMEQVSMLQRLDFANFSASASSIIRDIDPIRFGHQYTMLLAFLDRPWFGNGLGSFYANYHRFFAQAQSLGAGFYVDPPSSIFLMLAADLGIAGIAILMLFLGIVAKQILFVARTGRKLEPLTALCLGIAINFVVCSLIGFHLIFTSVSALAGIAFAVLTVDYQKRGPSGNADLL